jgi:hypothetical protein
MDLIRPDWPAPGRVRAYSTTRTGGCSEGPWASLNLGGNTGDDPDAVAQNRRLLRSMLPAEPLWLQQVHGTAVVRHGGAGTGAPEADASIAMAPGRVCVVLTADCLPVLICNRRGDRVAAAHAGWRGLAAGVLEATVSALGDDPGSLLAWLGPAIGPTVYEVGDDVRDVFLGQSAGDFSPCFTARGDRWLFDLYGAARLKLAAAGVRAVYGGSACTFSEPRRFYSYRRDGQTGRMASLIWLE